MKNENKRYYYNLQLEEISRLKKAGKRPTLLMHTCCAMCACWPIQYLTQYFDLTLYYYNDNIYPEAEYHKRLNELKRYVMEYNLEFNQDVKIIETPYCGEEYTRMLEPLKDEPEGGKRCLLCFNKRMQKAMQYAQENHYDYFTTVMTISRQKDSIVLNRIGEKLQGEYPAVRYFFSDFKKNGGQEMSNQLIKKYDIYRQNYCGCLYSYKEMLERVKRDLLTGAWKNVD